MNSDGCQQRVDGHWDVIVMGGGPAGSTTAALTAARGWRVLLLERAHHPRFHIGESLLPMSQPVFERLGISEAVARIGRLKRGADFVSPCGGRWSRFRFSDALDGVAHPVSYQVRREELDELLFRTAERHGAVTREGEEIRSIHPHPDRVRIDTCLTADGGRRRYTAREVVDATGRNALLARRHVGITRDRDHASAAVYSHFRNVRLDPGPDAGNIRIHWFEHGWIWLIPFRDGLVSIGAVCGPAYLKTRRGDLDDFLWNLLRRTPGLADRMTGAVMTRPAEATGNYSYSAHALTGPRWILVGDAYAFVDPMYSTGVHVALHAACLAADLVDARLRGAGREAARLAAHYESRMAGSLKIFSWFIHRMTQPAMRRLFLEPRNLLRIQEAMTSLLAGDLYGRTPVRRRLMLFRGLYYLFYLRDWRDNRAATRRRRMADAPTSL